MAWSPDQQREKLLDSSDTAADPEPCPAEPTSRAFSPDGEENQAL